MSDKTPSPAGGALFAPYARLRSGWQPDVLLEWNENGTLTTVRSHITEEVLGETLNLQRVCGPVLAGMPNLHSHAFQSAMAGLTEYRANAADSFWSWRDLMYRFAARLSPDSISAIAHWLYIEMLKAGYTSVCEFHYVHHQADGMRHTRPAELSERVVDAAEQAGIGMTMLPVLYQYSGFGAQAPRQDQRRFINTPEQLLDMLEGLRHARPESAQRRYGVAPHSLRAVSPSSLKALFNGLDRHFPNAPIHIHIAEQLAEVQACVETEGVRPVRWLLDHFKIDQRWCLVHATHVDGDETQALAQSGAVAGLCPITEANLGDGIFPAADYLSAQGRFGLGSDSHIGVDWRSELRLLEYGQRLLRHERNVLASPRQPQVADRLFDDAASGGALASGRSIGSLVVGRQADFMVLDPDHPHLAEQRPDMWLSGLVFSERGATTAIRDVYVAGRHVVRERRHHGEEQAYARYRLALTELLQQGSRS
jgi:formimidoylglutamate deiminase